MWLALNSFRMGSPLIYCVASVSDIESVKNLGLKTAILTMDMNIKLTEMYAVYLKRNLIYSAVFFYFFNV